MKTNLSKNLEEEVCGLIAKRPLYGYICAQMTRVPSENTPTIAIRRDLTVLYNPKFMEKCSYKERVALLEHEIQHFVRNHMNRLVGKPPQLANLAQDVAINQEIRDLPAGAIYPNTFGLPTNESCETYYNLLRQKAKNISCPIKGGKCTSQGNNGDGACDNCPYAKVKSLDDHSHMREGKKIPKSKVVQVMENAKKMIERSAGTVPGDYEELLANWERPTMVNWKKYIRMFTSAKMQPQKNLAFTKMKRSRRYKTVPGVKREKISGQLIVMWDTSGSMDDEVLKQTISETDKLYKKYKDILMIQIDTDVQKFEPYKTQPVVEIKGRGGTIFDGAFERIRDENLRRKGYRAMVAFTDGWPARWPSVELIESTGIDVLWVVTEESGYQSCKEAYEGKTNRVKMCLLGVDDA